MERKKGDKMLHISALVLVAGITSLSIVATEICKVISSK